MNQITTISINPSHNSSFKEDQVKDLMNSIENKLNMLANDDFQIEFRSGQKSSTQIEKDISIQPEKQQSPQTVGKKQNRLNIYDLETSFRNNQSKMMNFSKSDKKASSSMNQSKVINRINKMEEYYMNQITQMSYRITYLENQNERLNEKCKELEENHFKYKNIANRKEQENQKYLLKKMEEIKVDLIRKFSQQAQKQYEKHIMNLKEANQQLFQQRKRRRYFQDEVKLLESQKKLLNNQRQLLKMDVQKSKKENQKGNKIHSKREEISLKEHLKDKKSISGARSKKNKSKKQQMQPEHDQKKEMTKEQLIPFLAKGIQDLKAKLKVK